MAVKAEIANCRTKGGRIDVRFPYSRHYVDCMRTIAGRSYVGDVGDKHWHIPLDLETCRSLRRAFGTDLEIGQELRSWAFASRREEEKLGSIASSTTGTLTRLWSTLPTLAEAIHLGPLGRHMADSERVLALQGPGSYQAADVNFGVAAPAVGLFNEQGLGKTITWIGIVWESGLERGNHLVVAPKAAVGGTWARELANWQADNQSGLTIEIFACVDDRKSKESMLEAFRASTADVKWLVVNPEMLTYRIDKTNQGTIVISVSGKKADNACTCSARKGAHLHYTSPFPIIESTPWRTVCIDESHKGSIRNHKTLTSKALAHVRSHGKPCAMTGTPMKKTSGSDIWGILHWLRPDVFTSYWRFAEDFFEVTNNGFGIKVGPLRKDREEAMWRLFTPFVIRRLKSEVASWLPSKMYVPVDCFMGGNQYNQYKSTAEYAAVEMQDGSVIESSGVLDHFTRLRQFANAEWQMIDGVMQPVSSCKYEALLENLEESGTLDGSGKKHLIFSQSRRIIEWVYSNLRSEGYNVEMIHGGISKQAKRDKIMDDFQKGDTQVLCIVTTAGGVSLTLDAADDVHLLDEAWSHDEDEQAEDRAHRVSRIHQVTVYIYRTIDSVDTYVAEIKEQKKDVHEFMLDIRRRTIKDWYPALT